MTTKNILTELWDFWNRIEANLPNPPRLETEIIRIKLVANHPDLGNQLKRFLFSTMDEVRAKVSLDIGSKILAKTDMEEMNFFRDRLYKREKGQHIAYPGQRDHSAHTLNNFLLGFYFLENSSTMGQQLEDQFKKRELPFHRFYEMWQFVSLLHDIGYILEGGNPVLNADGHNEHAKLGGRIIQEFFDNWFWYSNNIYSKSAIELVYDKTGLKPIKIDNSNLASLLYSLTDLGDLKDLFGSSRITEKKIKIPDLNQGTHFDCFSLWESHYMTFSSKMENDITVSTMAQRIEALRDYTYNSARNDTTFGPRVLDHGACSGLLCLLNSTHYYKLFEKINSPGNKNKYQQVFLDAENDVDTDASYWWGGIVWATAASALHNYIQDDKAKKDPLSIEEDALAYLGILVDILQEWDRYKVFSSPADVGKLVQGNEVGMWTLEKDGQSKIFISYPNAKIVKKVKGALDSSLKDWSEIVHVIV